MKQATGVFTVVSLGFLLVWSIMTRDPQSDVEIKLASDVTQQASTPAADQVLQPELPSYSLSWVRAITEPIFSLRAMQRSVAAANSSTVTGKTTPLEKLLTAELTTRGLGPIRIGMTIAEAAKTGIRLVPMNTRDTGECQYLRPADTLEPIGFMVIDDRIIRIDIWPGSLTQTKSGVRIGSTEAEIYDYYPGQLEAEANPKTQGKIMTFVPSDTGENLYRLVFTTNAQGQVAEFRAGQFPAVTWPAGCL
ncbi:MAG TPA: hypothetical protein V6D29_22040 [Leptolyngbyaceae cyanobacterium]